MTPGKILRPLAASIALLTFVFALPRVGFAEEKSLYERLGGYDAVSAVVDDFAAKLFTDPVVGARFFGMSDDSREGFSPEKQEPGL